VTLHMILALAQNIEIQYVVLSIGAEEGVYVG
jgi:hypothetical protein